MYFSGFIYYIPPNLTSAFNEDFPAIRRSSNRIFQHREFRLLDTSLESNLNLQLQDEAKRTFALGLLHLHDSDFLILEECNTIEPGVLLHLCQTRLSWEHYLVWQFWRRNRHM